MKKRIAIWDNYKFFLITLVVLGHIFQELYNQSDFFIGGFIFIYTFHMPAFLFVSGLFSKRAINEKDMKSVLPYLTCYIVTNCFLFLIKQFMMPVSFSFFYIGSLPWFLLALFFMYLITMLVKDYKPAYIIVLSLLVGVFAGFCNKANPTFLSWMRVLIYYPFFYVGYAVDPEKVVEKMKKWYFKTIGIIFFVAIDILIYVYMHDAATLKILLTGRHPYSHMREYSEIGWVFRLLIYAISFAAIFLLVSITPTKRIRGITEFGKRTMAVYVFHFPVIYLITRVWGLPNQLKELLPIGWEAIMICIGMAIVYLCSNKGFNYLTNKLTCVDWKLKGKQ